MLLAPFSRIEWYTVVAFTSRVKHGVEKGVPVPELRWGGGL